MTLPSIPCKTLHYGPDGTGRDTYIKLIIIKSQFFTLHIELMKEAIYLIFQVFQ